MVNDSIHDSLFMTHRLWFNIHDRLRNQYQTVLETLSKTSLVSTQHNQPHTRSITKTSTWSNATALLNVPLPASTSSPAMETSDISSCIDEASDIQLNPAQQKSYLRVNSKSYEIHEMHVPLHRNIMRRYWSIHISPRKNSTHLSSSVALKMKDTRNANR